MIARCRVRLGKTGSLIGLMLGCCLGQSAIAQQPLSAIDWLGTRAAVVTQAAPAAPKQVPNRIEPPVAKTALAPDVQVQSLSDSGPRLIGLVPPSITGLSTDLWRASDVKTVVQSIKAAPDFDLPALQSLFYTLLLAEAHAPGDIARAGDALALVRVQALVKRGALDPAQALIEQAGVTSSSAHFATFMDIALLNGSEDRACAMLGAAPYLSDDYGVRIFCYGRLARWEDAALTFGSAQALGLMSQARLALLQRFLDPETEGTPTRPAGAIDPLTFRLLETIGEPVPTSTLPRAFAVADLRDVAGWKAQIEAAERLTRAGALPDNRLLGLYTDRRAAASGGVWDRVNTLQQFETALGTGSVDAVTKTLPPVWNAMAGADLAVSFANLFAERLAPITLTGRAGAISGTAQLLSPLYETAGQATDNETLASAVARGALPKVRPTSLIEVAVYDAFDTAEPAQTLVEMVQQKRLGEAILRALKQVHSGTRGDMQALRAGLSGLRALGLEDTARRAALQLLLLEG